MTDSYIQTF